MSIDKGSWLDALAKIFDVPLEFLDLKPPKPEPIVASGGFMASPLSDHSWGPVVDMNWSSKPDHMHFTPEPSADYFKGNGDVDPGTPAAWMVLGKAQPVVPTPAPVLIWETELGKIVQHGDHCQITLSGIVSTGTGLYQLGAELITEDPVLAKELIGLTPNDGPGTGKCFLDASAGGQKFTWEAGTGWIPKPDSGPLHASFPVVSTQKSGVKFQSWPESVPADGTRHTGPDGAVWEFHIKGGWRVVQQPDELFDGGEQAPYGWFCVYCAEHATVHGGDLVACDSGGWLRPATSAEHKKALLAGGTPS